MTLPRALLALPLAAVLAVPAAAQAISALKGHDGRAPIDVSADRIEVLDAERSALFQGNVRVRQGELTIESQRLRVVYEPRPGGDPIIRRLDADGAVRIRSPSETARARYGIYDVERRILTLIGDVELSQRDTTLKGDRLVLNLATGRSTLDGRGAAGGRVTGRFAVPPQR
ncbi:MAG: OstA family protein [Sphingomonadaceae bacterium]|uniref:LptA/OstA family protein n=1 Tax=Thermaurantiacus sp. TaxID=2820283 RepID=UPI00298F0DCF|nr:LptA/OstA family protein [Thermaurantiacus sp.]MCS6985870.1 OstA family protein [Sphingomonadaceae bacterium]MDW8413861.1 LptA/OstA family protein [Thermaurantiacus sp.]